MDYLTPTRIVVWVPQPFLNADCSLDNMALRAIRLLHCFLFTQYLSSSIHLLAQVGIISTIWKTISPYFLALTIYFQCRFKNSRNGELISIGTALAYDITL